MGSRDPLSMIGSALAESARVKEALRAEAPVILRVARRMAMTVRSGGRLYACGNGGSACDAIHLVEELVARYDRDRPGIPAHHLLDAPTLTCWSNDREFETVFSRQVETLVRPGDVLVAISTSGDSRNVVLAVEAAHERGAWSLGLTGGSGGKLRELCTETIAVPARETSRIQEGHVTVIHILCELLEEALFGELELEFPADQPEVDR
jgi:D-sedoheptulose 7-phosphate isomerase